MAHNFHLGLDPTTLLVSLAVLGFLLSMLSFNFPRHWAARRFGLAEWGNAMFSLGASSLLFYFRGVAPFVFTFLVANTLVILVTPYILLAYVRLFEIKAPLFSIALTSVFGVSGVLAHYFFDTPIQFAVFTINLALAIQLVMVIRIISKHIDVRSTASAWISCSVSALLAVPLAMRAILGLFGDSPSAFVEAKPLPIGMTIVGAIFAVASSISFFSMVNEKHQRETLEHLRRDGLTGLFSRTTFFELAAELDAHRTSGLYSVVMVDIDHFKSINDSYGHKAGDTTLAHIGRLIANSVRLSDIAGRYGGEEFCIILRDCAESEAAVFAARLVSDASQQAVRQGDGRDVRFTLSAGYAVRRVSASQGADFESFSDVIERADQALYRAKSGGRNQAVPASPPCGGVTAMA